MKPGQYALWDPRHLQTFLLRAHGTECTGARETEELNEVSGTRFRDGMNASRQEKQDT